MVATNSGMTVVDKQEMAAGRGDSRISVQAVLDRLEMVQDLMRRAMIKDVDYGQIPGTGSKPTLLKPGAEKLAVMFRLAPEYVTTKTFHDDGHLTVESTCKIHDGDGRFLGEASAMCSTRESKYAFRRSDRICPQCGKSTIIKGKAEYGGGWLCFAKKGGCGGKFSDHDPEITSQTVGRVANPDLADAYNTVLRIAEKRSFLGAIRLATGSSALFDEEIPGVNEADDHGHDAPQATVPPRLDQIPGLKRGSEIQPPQPQGFVNEDQATELKTLFVDREANIDDLLAHYGLTTEGLGWSDKLDLLHKVPASDFTKIRKKLAAKPFRKPEEATVGDAAE